MNLQNLERLNKSEMEERAILVLNHFDKKYFDLCRRTPIDQIIKNLVDRGYLHYDDSSILGYGSDNSRILGTYLAASKLIAVDSTLKKDVKRLHFVQAHELGHFVLHRKVLTEDNDVVSVEHTEHQIYSVKKDLVTQMDFMEWQANYFASVLLLPSQMVLCKAIELYKQMGSAWRGAIYVDDQMCTRNDFYQMLNSLSEYFKVSKAVVEIRLRSMNLIRDKRSKTAMPKSILEVFKDA